MDEAGSAQQAASKAGLEREQGDLPRDIRRVIYRRASISATENRRARWHLQPQQVGLAGSRRVRLCTGQHPW